MSITHEGRKSSSINTEQDVRRIAAGAVVAMLGTVASAKRTPLFYCLLGNFFRLLVCIE